MSLEKVRTLLKFDVTTKKQKRKDIADLGIEAKVGKAWEGRSRRKKWKRKLKAVTKGEAVGNSLYLLIPRKKASVKVKTSLVSLPSIPSCRNCFCCSKDLLVNS